MTVNSLSPGFVKLAYNSNGHDHIMTLPCVPYGTVTPGVEPQFTINNDGSLDMEDAVGAFVEAIDHLFHTGTSFGEATFWSQPTPDDDPLWIYSYTEGAAGASGTANVALSECVMSFRTNLGGLLKLYLMEGWVPVNTRDVPPWAAGFLSVFTYMSGSTGWVRGRDNGKVVGYINVTAKTNDALRKKFVLDE